MFDSIAALGGGEEAVRNVLPREFHTSLFMSALALMSSPVIEMLRQTLAGVRRKPSVKASELSISTSAGP
jgi:hypothetical protein